MHSVRERNLDIMRGQGSMKTHNWLQRLGVCVVLTGLILTLSLSGGAIGVRAGGSSSPYRTTQVVVKLNPASGATIDDIDATYGTTIIKPLSQIAGIYLLQVAAGHDAQADAAVMDNDLRFLYSEPNFIAEPPEGNPSGIGAWGGFNAAPYSSQYALDLLGISHAQMLSRGAGSVVAVLDTGVQLDHPALASSLIAGYDFVDNDATPDDKFVGLDENGNGILDERAGHGTHVSGIVHLVAPDAKIMPVRVLDSEGYGDVFNVAQGIAFAVSNGANVINLSLGTISQSGLLDDAVRDATRHGVVVVAAAGNRSSNVMQYPAGSPCALSVTSMGPTSIKSPFANFGGWVDYVAPGEAIYSTFPRSGYAWWSGTSMATPFIAGQAALIYSKAPALNVQYIATLITGTAHSIDALNPLFVGQLGMGQIDIGASLDVLASGVLPTSGKGIIGSSCVQ
jgi:thermitase